jgi:putative membrane protein
MTRAASWLLSAGVLLFIGLLLSQGLSAVLSTLALAGWGLLLIALFHLVPLGLDALAIRILFVDSGTSTPMRDAVLARWVGESANSLMPAGQLGGPVLMARYLAQRGMRMDAAAAAITVSTTLQTFAQILFALAGVALLGLHAGHFSQSVVRGAVLFVSGLLALQVGGFYLLQRRGFFSKLTRIAMRFSGGRDWSQWVSKAEAMDRAIQHTYARPGPIAASFALMLVGWFVGTAEVYLAVRFLGHPVSWSDALLLESLGQAIRAAAFAIPGALGVQEGGYLLLAPLAGLPADVALALSLAKRARELLLGIPGLVYLHFWERGSNGAARAAPP